MSPRALSAGLALALIVPAAAAAPAHAQTDPSPASLSAVAGRVVESPRAGALVKQLPVRVALRVPAATTDLRVRVGRRDVSARFRAAGDGRRVARLTRRDGLRFGSNRLTVVAERRGGRPLIQARSFAVLRRTPGLLRMGIRPGPVTALPARVAGAGQLAALRRSRTVKLWVNGRGATAALDRTRLTRFSASLSAADGVRYGVNRLRLLVAEPDAGRYAIVTRRFVVRRTRHLPSAGRDVTTRAGALVRLDGRRSQTAGGRSPVRRWRIVRRPAGSRAVLRGARSARPALTADRPGRYVVRLTLDERAARVRGPRAAAAATAPQQDVTPAQSQPPADVDPPAQTQPPGTVRPPADTQPPADVTPPPATDAPADDDPLATVAPGTQTLDAPAASDFVEITAAPAPSLLPFAGIATQNGRHGIQVGDAFYANPSPSGTAMQWLTLDRTTLLPIANSWLDGTGSGPNGIPQLTQALQRQGLRQLVILSVPYDRRIGPPVQADQNDAFNAAMATIGVESIGANILQDRNKMAVVGVPGGGAGSGWYTHGGGDVDGLEGWLMPDRVNGFRFNPARPAYETAASSTATSNTMMLAGRRLDAALPAGATGGFQVAWLNPIDFTANDMRVVATNGVSDPVAALRSLADLIDATGDRHIVVQSIGTVRRPARSSDPYTPDPGADAWTRLGQSLAAHGANPNTFLNVDGRYAFVGGTTIERGQAAQSSTSVVVDPTTTPPTTQAGTLGGRLTIRSDGYVIPVAADPSSRLDYALYDMVFRAPTPWPYSRESGDPDAAAYARALAYVTACLPQTRQWGDNLRVAYTGDLNRDWSTVKDDLRDVNHPRDGACIGGDARFAHDPGFSRAQLEDLTTELQLEFDWLHDTKTLFDAYKGVLSASGAQGQVDLHTIGSQIENDISPPDVDYWADIGNFVMQMLEMAALFVTLPEGSPLAIAIAEGVAASYEISMSMSADARSGAPLARQVSTKVDDLSQRAADQLAAASRSIDSLREVVVSDYGRLSTVGRAAASPAWAVNTDALEYNVSTVAKGYFSTQLMPVAYDVWYLSPTFSWDDTTPDSCYLFGYGHSFRGGRAYLDWNMPFPGQSDRGGSLLALGKRSWTVSQYAYPPAELTDRTFAPVIQGGYGVSLSDFFWTAFTAPYPYVSCYS